MTTLESKKYHLISAIISDTDENRVFEIERLYNSAPCLYSDEELRASIVRRKRDFDAGKTTAIPHELLKRRSV
jgi:hypothetical protein